MFAFQRSGLWDRFILLILVSGSLQAMGQNTVEEKLWNKYKQAHSDSTIIVSIGELAHFYFANKDFDKADSLIERQIMLAEATLKPKLVLNAYFGNAGYQSTAATTRDRSENTRKYIERAMEYARVNNFNDYVAFAYASLSALCANIGKIDDAFRYAALGSATALNTDNDSAKVICTIQLGNIYQQRSDILQAFRNYTNASNLAQNREDGSLLPPVYHAISILYKKLGKAETARNYIFRSLALNKKNNNLSGQVQDNISLAKLSDYAAGKQYLQEAITIANNISNVTLLIEAERILFSHMLLKEKPAFMIDYISKRPELKNLFINTGENYFDWMLAEIYLYGGSHDTALSYFKKAEPAFNRGYDLLTQKNFFSEYAWCLSVLGRDKDAIEYYKKTFDLARAASDLSRLQSHSASLRDLYKKTGDYEKAFNYSMLFEHYKDSVDLLGRERDLALMEINNEEKEQVRLTEEAERKLQREHNLKYMLITLMIAGMFLVILLVGMFKVSTFMIRLMGFLSLIFFFEFIILILDNKIHHLTHGDPLQVWLIKIGIIALLLPTHHYLEHKLIHYLMSRHLIRKRLAISAWFRKKKTRTKQQAPVTDKPVA